MRRLLLAVAALVAVVLVGGCGAGGGQTPAQGSVAETQQAIGAKPIDGYTVSVPKIGVRSSLIPLGRNPDGTIQVPPLAQVEQAGVYDDGPMPGDVGPAAILGHINGGGRPGVFSRLGELAEGDTIDVAGPGGETDQFTVYKVQLVPKAEFPTAAVYSNTAGPELRLITCGGTLSGRNYLDNVIVFARET